MIRYGSLWCARARQFDSVPQTGQCSIDMRVPHDKRLPSDSAIGRGLRRLCRCLGYVRCCAVRAASYTWSVQSGDWSVASNWGGTGPTYLDNAYVINGGTATITVPYCNCESLYLGDPNSTNSGTIQMSSGGLSASPAYIGNNGTGTFDQSGGTTFSKAIYLRNTVGSNGTYNLSGSGVITWNAYFGGNTYVGNSGTGTFNQSGGTNNLTDGPS